MARRLWALLLLLCLALVTACTGQDERRPSPVGAAATSADATPADVSPSTGPVQNLGTATQDPGAATQDPGAATQEPSADEAPAAVLPDGPVTALLVGTDSRGEAEAGRSDVIVLVQLSEDREHLTLVSIARDTYVDIPGHGRDKVNAAYAEGGTPLLRRTVAGLMGGLDIDLVAEADFELFTDLTSWMDGFWVDNEHRSTVVSGSGGQVEFAEGRILLQDTEALAYVRERQSLPLGDLDRAQRHRAALAGMLERLVEIRAEDPGRLVQLLPMLLEHVHVEAGEAVGLQHLVAMVDVASRLGPEDVTSLMVPVAAFDTTDTGASINVLDEDRTRELAEGLREGNVSDYVERYGTSYAPTGG